MAEDEVRAPNREMQRDRGVLIPRVFNFNNGNYGNLPRDDNIGLDTYKSMMKDSQVKAGIEVVRLATMVDVHPISKVVVPLAFTQSFDMVNGVMLCLVLSSKTNLTHH